jgi:hypothetical protein
MAEYTINDSSTKCTCGRTFTHCKVCGNRTVYKKKLRSAELSMEFGRPVAVFSCQRCGNESNSVEECKAQPYGDVVQRTPFRVEERPKVEKPKDLRPQFVLEHDTVEYVAAFNAKYLDMANSMKYRTREAIHEAMSKDGWTILPDGEFTTEGNRIRFAIQTEQVQMEPTEQDLTLDDVIEKMKKEAQS